MRAEMNYYHFTLTPGLPVGGCLCILRIEGKSVRLQPIQRLVRTTRVNQTIGPQSVTAAKGAEFW